MAKPGDILKANLIIRVLRKLSGIMTRQEKRAGFGVLLLINLGALLEIIALAALFLMSLVVLSPDNIQKNRLLNKVFLMGGFEDPDRFMLALIIGIFFLYLLKNFIQLFILYKQTVFTFDLATSLAERQFRRMFARGYEYMKSNNSALLINKVLNVPSILASGTILPLIYFSSELILLLMTITGIFLMNPLLFGALVLTTAPVVLLIYRRSRHRLYVMGQERHQMFTKTVDKLNQSIFGYVDVMLTNKSLPLLEDFLVMQRQMNRNQTYQHMVSVLPQRALESVAMLGVLVLFLFAQGISTARGELLEFMTAFVLSAFRILPSLNRTIYAVMQIQTAESNLENFEEDADDSHVFSNKPLTKLPFSTSIEVKGLKFSYQGAEKNVLDGIDLVVKKGERVGIVGPSGSGKTTLIKILLRFLQEQEGGIWVDGRKLDLSCEAEWRNRIGYVQQDVFIVDGTLSENIAFGEKPSQVDPGKVTRAIHQASLDSLVERLDGGIEGQIGERGSMLSGGQRQRVGIARALYRDADVLIFDEATSSLDTQTEQEITEAIESLSDKEKTLIIIAHRVTTLRSCDKIYEISEGRISGVYTYSEILKKVLSN